MDQDLSSNPVTQAPTAPASSDDSAVNPAAAFAPEAPAATVTDALDTPIVAPDLTTATTSTPIQDADVTGEVVKKITEAQNVLVALSGNPSVDEMAAAIGLSLFLDKLGKRATAIYSGSTPNALEFLKPEETFETTADTLQDFVIALNKDKADHLRYKLDGDYVKIYITPYRTRIDEKDLEFSYGDYNVDLVLALDVSNGIDLDAALREHGRIMHDAVVVNITTGNPGKFGEIEWSNKTASSISEMIAKLLYNINGGVKIEKDEATAFLTGIVAATNRFSNAKTTPETMQIASRLMQSGANQQLISKNITPDVDNEIYSLLSDNTPKREVDPTKLDIKHGNEENISKAIDTPIIEEASSLLDDLKAAEASLATAGSETVPDTSNQPVRLDNAATITPIVETESSSSPSPSPVEEPVAGPVTEPVASTAPIEPISPSSEPTPATEPSLPPVASSSDFTIEPAPSKPASEPSSNEEGITGDSGKPEKVVRPSPDMDLNVPEESPDKYSKMLEDTISGLGDIPAQAATPPIIDNPASNMAPQVASTPEINGVPEMNYMPMPGEEVLPPPPTPPIDMSVPAPETPIAPAAPAAPIESVAPVASNEPVEPIQPAVPPVEPAPISLGSQPAMQDQVYTPQAVDPGAFKIPGM